MEDERVVPQVVKLKRKFVKNSDGTRARNPDGTEKSEVVQGCSVYIGDKMTKGGWDLPKSKWYNKFKTSKNKGITREDTVLQYWDWIQHSDQKHLFDQIPELEGEELGCWCKAEGYEPCHGDVLLYFANGPEFLSETLEGILIRADRMDKPEEKEEVYDNETMRSLRRETRKLQVRTPRVHLNRVRAALVGLALGDALGVPHEFPKWGKFPYTGKLEHRFIHKGAARFGKVPPKTLAVGQYSDDTEMMLSLARSLIDNKGYNDREVIKAYVKWARTTPLIGSDTKYLFNITKRAKDPEGVTKYIENYQEKFGLSPFRPFRVENEKAEEMQSNDSLMRCFPFACLWDKKAISQDIWLSNPSTIVREVEHIYIRCVRNALRGVSAVDIWDDAWSLQQSEDVVQAFEDVANEVDRDLGDIGKGKEKIKRKSWCVNSFYTAMYCLYQLAYGEDVTYSSLMEWVITRPNSDTDTNASISGALVGAILGWDAMISEPDVVPNIEIMIASTSEGSITDINRNPEYRLEDIETVARGLTFLSGL